MEAPLEDETPVGTLADSEGPEQGAERKASEEAVAFMSSVGEFFSVYFLGFSEVSTGDTNCARLRVSATWFRHILTGMETLIHVRIQQKIENYLYETELWLMSKLKPPRPSVRACRAAEVCVYGLSGDCVRGRPRPGEVQCDGGVCP